MQTGRTSGREKLCVVLGATIDWSVVWDCQLLKMAWVRCILQNAACMISLHLSIRTKCWRASGLRKSREYPIYVGEWSAWGWLRRIKKRFMRSVCVSTGQRLSIRCSLWGLIGRRQSVTPWPPGTNRLEATAATCDGDLCIVVRAVWLKNYVVTDEDMANVAEAGAHETVENMFEL